jgi:microcystin degradation protein MlrC
MAAGRPRLALLGVYHEANTFSPLVVDMAEFERGELLRAEEIRDRYEGTPSTIGGMLAAADAAGAHVEPLLFARVTPSGPIAREAFDRLLEEMLEALAAGAPWDGVLLALHGAAVAEHVQEVDAEVAQRVRHTVGAGTPVGTVLDMHANLTARLPSSVDLVFGYRTNPHVDAAHRGGDCARALLRVIRGEASPAHAFAALPLVSSIARQDTDEPPMERIMARVRRWDEEPSMLAVSVFEGYPYADVPGMGMSVVAADDDGGAAAAEAVSDLSRLIWESRDELQGGGLSIDEALDVAARASEWPVVLLDVGDNIGGGAPGDSMVLWRAARERAVDRVVQTAVDPDAVRACVAAGVGGRVALRVGACHEHSPGEPAEVSGRVAALSDGRFSEPGTVHGGFRHFDMGPTAVVEAREGTLVISARAVGNISIEQFASHGVAPRDYRVVIAKGVNAPRAAYRSIAAELVVVDTPGVTTLRYQELPYRHRRRPLYPFEPETTIETAA